MRNSFYIKNEIKIPNTSLFVFIFTWKLESKSSACASSNVSRHVTTFTRWGLFLRWNLWKGTFSLFALRYCAVLTDAALGCATSEICRLLLLLIDQLLWSISYFDQLLWSLLMLSHCTTVQYWPIPHLVVPRLK
jgi:hypothetical protein